MTKTVLGIIGGSGIYEIAALENARREHITSPWGEPSDALLTGRLNGMDMVFLPRHGRGHVHSPTSINYRANIDALKRAGVTDVISVSACGSLREDLPPGTFVIADQFIDRTHAREKSFYGCGFVAHVTVEQVIAVLNANAAKARRLVARVAPKLGPGRTPSPLGIEHVLDTALITAPDKRDPELFAKLDAVAGRVLKKV